MEAAISIVASLVQLAIFVGLIVFVVKLITKKGSSSAEGSGVSIRRFFQYSIMLVMLGVAAFGIIGIIDAVASAGAAPGIGSRRPRRLPDPRRPARPIRARSASRWT